MTQAEQDAIAARIRADLRAQVQGLDAQEHNGVPHVWWIRHADVLALLAAHTPTPPQCEACGGAKSIRVIADGVDVGRQTCPACAP